MTTLQEQLRLLSQEVLMTHQSMDTDALARICEILDRHTEPGYTYLASPYSSDNPEVRNERYRCVLHAAARLMERGEVVFSPIVHSHNIEIMGMSTVHGWEFWKRQDEPMLRRASRLMVLQLPGWLESRGVKWEIVTAHDLGIPIKWVKAEEL